MLRICLSVFAAILLSAPSAEARHKDGHAQTEEAKKPAAEETDPLKDPTVVPRWFGQAVDDILTGAGKALDVKDNPKR